MSVELTLRVSSPEEVNTVCLTAILALGIALSEHNNLDYKEQVTPICNELRKRGIEVDLNEWSLLLQRMKVEHDL